MKRLITIGFFLIFCITNLAASYYADGEFEARITKITAYTKDADGNIILTMTVEIKKLLSSGGHNKDHAKILLDSVVTADFIVDPLVKNFEIGQTIKVDWSYMNSKGAKGMIEATSWKVIN